jgi:hypothetical protein
MGELQNQVAVITGAASGIDLEIARLFYREGARLLLVDRNGDALKSIQSDFQDSEGRVFSYVADVTKSSMVDAFVEEAVPCERSGNCWPKPDRSVDRRTMARAASCYAPWGSLRGQGGSPANDQAKIGWENNQPFIRSLYGSSQRGGRLLHGEGSGEHGY